MMNAGPVEFSALVYGSFVNSLLEMTEDIEEVNKKLDEIGYRIGLRLAHDFAKDTSIERIDAAGKVVEGVIAKKWPIISGSKSPVTYTSSGDTYVLSFQQSVFTQNVQIPETYAGVQYTGMLPGAIRGIFEIFHFKVTAALDNSEPTNPPSTKIVVKVLESIMEAIPKNDD